MKRDFNHIDNKKLRACICSVYQGPLHEEKKGFKIRCPWHYPDNNPSCMIFYGTGLFYCVVCHGDRPKGKRGVGPYKAFQELGMSEEKARKLFIEKEDVLSFDLEPTHLPDVLGMSSVGPSVLPKSKVLVREPWPKWWGFRDVACHTLRQPWFLDRFEPEKVYLEKERLPRLSLAVGGSEKFKNISHVDYLRAEVCLRLSSAVKSKTKNSPALNLDPEISRPLPASLFGLVNNKLHEHCCGLILVEGPYDCIHLQQHTHDLRMGNYHFDVVALMGTPQWDNIRRQIQLYLQGDLIKRKIPIITAFDNDAAGEKLTQTATNDLRTDFFPTSLLKTLEYPHKDPGNLSFNEFYDSLVHLGLILIQ